MTKVILPVLVQAGKTSFNKVPVFKRCPLTSGPFNVSPVGFLNTSIISDILSLRINTVNL